MFSCCTSSQSRFYCNLNWLCNDLRVTPHDLLTDSSAVGASGVQVSPCAATLLRCYAATPATRAATPLRRNASTPLRCYAAAPLRRCTDSAPIRRYAATLLHRYAATPLRRFAATPLRRYTDSAPIRCYAVTPLRCYAATPLRRYAAPSR